MKKTAAGGMELSICIPTFNRGSFVREAVLEIDRQARDLSGARCEICISDNASSDDTAAIVKELALKCAVPLSFRRNQENLGADANFAGVVDMAKGRYCLLHGSDDALEEGALAMLLDAIDKDPADILVGERVEYAGDSFLERRGPTDWLSRIAAGKRYDFSRPEDRAEYMGKVGQLGGLFSYMSGFVFRRSSWEDAAVPPSAWGSAYIHACKMLALMAGGATLQKLEKPIMKCRLNMDEFSFDRVLGAYQRHLVDHRYLLFALEIFGLDSSEYGMIKQILYRTLPPRKVWKLKADLAMAGRFSDCRKLALLYRNLGMRRSLAALRLFPAGILAPLFTKVYAVAKKAHYGMRAGR